MINLDNPKNLKLKANSKESMKDSKEVAKNYYKFNKKLWKRWLLKENFVNKKFKNLRKNSQKKKK